MQDFTGRTALVTGAGAGIGWATAQLFAERGARVAIVDISAETARARAAELGADHLAIGCDITDEAGVRRAVAEIGRVDIVVNNAGVGDVSEPSLDQSLDAIRRVVDIHLIGSFCVAREAARGMIAEGQPGAIVNLASIAGLTGLPRRNAYGAAKAGIVAMTRSLACEWAAQGIRVNAVAPGYVATDLVQKLIADGMVDIELIKSRIPMGRLLAPREIAESIAFLASDAASAITGTVLSADAGWVAYGGAGPAFSAAENS